MPSNCVYFSVKRMGKQVGIFPIPCLRQFCQILQLWTHTIIQLWLGVAIIRQSWTEPHILRPVMSGKKTIYSFCKEIFWYLIKNFITTQFWFLFCFIQYDFFHEIVSKVGLEFWTKIELNKAVSYCYCISKQ